MATSMGCVVIVCGYCVRVLCVCVGIVCGYEFCRVWPSLAEPCRAPAEPLPSPCRAPFDPLASFGYSGLVLRVYLYGYCVWVLRVREGILCEYCM